MFGIGIGALCRFAFGCRVCSGRIGLLLEGSAPIGRLLDILSPCNQAFLEKHTIRGESFAQPRRSADILRILHQTCERLLSRIRTCQLLSGTLAFDSLPSTLLPPSRRAPNMTISDYIRRAVVYPVLELHKPVAFMAAELRICLRSAERILLYQSVHADIHPNIETRRLHEDTVQRHHASAARSVRRSRPTRRPS